MKIVCEELSKRFQREWIFKKFDFVFEDNSATAITGNNGSGKSTLLKVLAGLENFHKGKITYTFQSKEIKEDTLYQFLAIVAPYQSLIEEFTLQEFINFHEKMIGMKIDQTFINELKLEKSVNKLISNFSSGMKQRLKLAIAIASKRPFLMLDEPTMNMDVEGIEWYKNQLEKIKGTCTILICSNVPEEYSICDQVINITDYKV